MIAKWLRLSCFSLLCFFYSITAQADLKIGLVFYDPPLVISVNQGFNVDFANSICRGLQEKCFIIPMVWNELFGLLDKGEIDLILGAFITPKRAQKYLFSIPYMASNGRMIILRDSKLSNVEQLKGLNVGVVKEEAESGVFYNYIRANFLNVFNVTTFADIETILSAVMNKTVQAGIMHQTAVDYWIANSNHIFSPLGKVFPVGNGYGILALPNRQDLINKVNQQIQLIKSNGEFAKIYKTYFSDDTLLQQKIS